MAEFQAPTPEIRQPGPDAQGSSSIRHSTLDARHSAWGGADVVRLALGALLLVAAALKAHQLATEPVGNCARLSCHLLALLELSAEWLLGLWLISGLAEHAARMMAGVCFASFALVTFHKGWIGEESCGCFGKVAVNPWLTLGLDAAAVAALVIFRKAGRAGVCGRSLRAAGLVLAGIAGIVASLAVIARYEPARLLADGGFSSGDRNVLLEPTQWAGNPRWPLLDHVDIGSDLSRGRWMVMLYRARCPACRKALKPFAADAARSAGTRYAVIELPPFAPPAKSPLPANQPFLVGRLSDRRTWYVHTPLVVTLQDGQAVSAQKP